MRSVVLSVLVVCLFPCAQQCRASIVLTSISPAYNQNFNSLASVGTSNVVPAFWFFSETGPSANTTYFANDGSDNLGNTFSYGFEEAADRAFGMLRSGVTVQVVSIIGAKFSNGSTAPIESLAIDYHGEQWRLGFTDDPPRTDRLDFQYSFDATSLTSGTWIDADALDFVSPKITGPTGALDGTLPANSDDVSATVSGLAIAPSASFWIRWTDFNAIGSDDGLAVDDFNITAGYAAVPEPAALVFGVVAVGLATAGMAARRFFRR